MESFAKIEIQGIVGLVQKTEVGGNPLCLFQVMVSENIDGTSLNTQWFGCQGINLNVEKGDNVHLTGRVRSIKYTDTEGELHHSWQILVDKIEKL